MKTPAYDRDLERDTIGYREKNPTFISMLKSYRLISISGTNPYTVVSASGNTYTVRRSTKMDELGSYYEKYTCDCPARKTCRHIAAVQQMEHAELEAAERFEEMENIENAER